MHNATVFLGLLPELAARGHIFIMAAAPAEIFGKTTFALAVKFVVLSVILINLFHVYLNFIVIVNLSVNEMLAEAVIFCGDSVNPQSIYRLCSATKG